MPWQERMEVARCGLWAPGDRTSAHPSAPQTYQCKITQSTGVATKKQREVFLVGNRSFREKTKQKIRVFLDVIFDVDTENLT